MVNATELLAHPAFWSLLATLLSLWPLALILRRTGRNGWLALLLLPNIALPFIGYILVGATLLFLKPQEKTKQAQA